MILVNGTHGIGTGFSSTVCPHRLEDVVKAMKNRMNGSLGLGLCCPSSLDALLNLSIIFWYVS